jgi:hypothetical protein
MKMFLLNPILQQPQPIILHHLLATIDAVDDFRFAAALALDFFQLKLVVVDFLGDLLVFEELVDAAGLLGRF